VFELQQLPRVADTGCPSTPGWAAGGFQNAGALALGSAAYCMLFIANCLLSIVYCLLSVVYCLLSIVYCLLSIVYCILPIAYCLLSVGHELLAPIDRHLAGLEPAHVLVLEERILLVRGALAANLHHEP
jgi:hypothetical protein